MLLPSYDKRNAPTRKSEAGASLVEFAVSLPVYLAVILGIAALVRVSFVNVTMQHVVTEVGREVTLGMHSSIADVRSAVVNRAASLGVSLAREGVVVCRVLDARCHGLQEGGQPPDTDISRPSEWIYLEANQVVRAFYFAWNVNLQASVVVKNEPF